MVGEKRPLNSNLFEPEFFRKSSHLHNQDLSSDKSIKGLSKQVNPNKLLVQEVIPILL